jgi:hypothetical protein
MKEPSGKGPENRPFIRFPSVEDVSVRREVKEHVVWIGNDVDHDIGSRRLVCLRNEEKQGIK